ncbi:hypothetical protein [Pontimicrobium aquaticum]|uniref:Viral A-type inclusion protein n=1 Tax=Pontimicrobium aquaticum TaxID=2565367 RepID=A0A4U0EV56_9FLAO|nr:hypothetical protein [Pontimicrobium aquaticum]TJY35796.1 hypothetical protein E5167_07960 [Pontimicrobium aquaticum]
MKKAIILLAVLITVVTSCKNTENETKELTRMERVIAVHDEVMPKMGTIGRLISQLEPKVDSTEIGMQYKAAKDDLEEAHTYMMDWMKGFGERFDGDEILEGKTLSKEKEVLLIEEEKKVNIMKDMINNSITKAEALLKEEN